MRGVGDGLLEMGVINLLAKIPHLERIDEPLTGVRACGDYLVERDWRIDSCYIMLRVHTDKSQVRAIY